MTNVYAEERQRRRETDERRSAWEQRWGWKVGKMHPCPTKVLKGRHSDFDYCCCSGSAFHPALDHVHKVTKGDRVGLLSQPYGLTSDSAAALTEWAAELDAYWWCIGDGWWYPGTVAILITPMTGGEA